MKPETGLVPAFHSHWPCRSLYRRPYSSLLSFHLVILLLLSLLVVLLLRSYSSLFLEKKRVLFDRLPPSFPAAAPPSFPASLRHISLELLNVNWIAVPRVSSQSTHYSPRTSQNSQNLRRCPSASDFHFVGKRLAKTAIFRLLRGFSVNPSARIGRQVVGWQALGNCVAKKRKRATSKFRDFYRKL